MDSHIPELPEGSPLLPNPPTTTPLPKTSRPSKEQLAVFRDAIYQLRPKNKVDKQFMKNAERHLDAVELPKGFCLIEKGEIAKYVYFIVIGGVLVFGDRWEEIQRILNGQTEHLKIMNAISEKAQRDRENITIIEFLLAGAFILPIYLLFKRPSPVRIVVAEYTELLIMERRVFRKLLQRYHPANKLYKRWIEVRNETLIANEMELEGLKAINAMVWLGRKWKDSIRDIADEIIGQILGFCRKEIGRKRPQVIDILLAEEKSINPEV